MVPSYVNYPKNPSHTSVLVDMSMQHDHWSMVYNTNWIQIELQLIMYTWRLSADSFCIAIVHLLSIFNWMSFECGRLLFRHYLNNKQIICINCLYCYCCLKYLSLFWLSSLLSRFSHTPTDRNHSSFCFFVFMMFYFSSEARSLRLHSYFSYIHTLTDGIVKRFKDLNPNGADKKTNEHTHDSSYY